MNSLKQKIVTASKKADLIEQQIKILSRKLAEKFNLSQSDIDLMSEHKIYHEILGRYKIQSVSRPQYQWNKILEVSPIDSGLDYGYSNSCQLRVPDGWFYEMKGTATKILPDETTIQQILSSPLESIH